MRNFFHQKENFTIKTTLSKDEAIKRIRNRTKIVRFAGIKLVRNGKDNASFFGNVYSDGFEIYNRKPFITKHKGKFDSRDRVKIAGKVSAFDNYTQIDLDIRPAYFLAPSNYSVYFLCSCF